MWLPWAITLMALSMTETCGKGTSLDGRWSEGNTSPARDAETGLCAESVKTHLIRAMEMLRLKGKAYDAGRQDYDEDEDLPDLVPEILKIVGSALAGNATALIDNSISLIPPGVTSTISGALNVLVDSINSARPATTSPAPPKTTESPDESSSVASPAPTNPSSPTLQSVTEEDEEDSDADTTPETGLRTNSSSSPPLTPPAPSSTSLAPLTTPTSASPPATHTPTQPLTTAAPTAAINSDNKANWMSLVPTDTSQLEEDTKDALDVDNKANWATLLGVDGSSASAKDKRRPSSGVRDNSKAPGQSILDAVSQLSPLSRYPASHREPAPAAERANGTGGQHSLSSQLTALLQQKKPQLSNYSSNVLKLIKYQDWLAKQLTTTARGASLGLNSDAPSVGNYAAGFEYGKFSSSGTDSTARGTSLAEDEDEDEDEDGL